MDCKEAKKQLEEIREYVNERIDKQELVMEMLDCTTDWRRNTISVLADILGIISRKIIKLNETNK